MILLEKPFTYAGISSDQFGLIFANVDSSAMNQMAGEISGQTIFNKKSKQRYLISDDYSNSPVSFSIDIIKSDTSIIDDTTRRTIEKWLFNRHSYRRLEINTSCDGVNIGNTTLFMNCRFMSPRYIETSDGIIGYNVTAELDSGWAYEQETIVDKSFLDTDPTSINNVTVNVDTDIDDYIYPRVEVTMGRYGGTFSIFNNDDYTSVTRNTTIDNMAGNSSVTLNGEINYVSGNHYSDFANSNFVRLVDGTNILHFLGDVKRIRIIWNNRRNIW